MTEVQWGACVDPDLMLEFLRPNIRRDAMAQQVQFHSSLPML